MEQPQIIITEKRYKELLLAEESILKNNILIRPYHFYYGPGGINTGVEVCNIKTERDLIKKLMDDIDSMNFDFNTKHGALNLKYERLRQRGFWDRLFNVI